MASNPSAQAGSSPPIKSGHMGPVAAAGRLVHLDMLRGLALFGILLINAEQMFQPFFFSDLDYANAPVGVVPGETGAVWNWAILHTLFDTKFITLFSLLFGIGFALQIERAQSRAQPFTGIYMRRMFVLALFGIFHAILFYPADVLVNYAVTGTVFFLLARNWTPAMLFQVGVILFLTTVSALLILNGPEPSIVALLAAPSIMIVVAILGSRLKWPMWVRCLAFLTVIGATFAMQVNGRPDAPPEHSLSEIQETADAVSSAFAKGSFEFDGVEYPLPLDAEALDKIMSVEGLNATQSNIVEQSIMRAGPPSAYFERGLSALAAFQVFGVLYLYWRSFALFAIGAAFMKWGLLKNDSNFAKPAMILGLGIGLPLALLATWMQFSSLTTDNSIYALGEPVHSLSSLLIAVGIVGLVSLWSRTKVMAWLAGGLSHLGRMALTNYIAQSAALAYVSAWYGLGLAGSLTRWEQSFVCVGIFTALALASRAWLLIFEYGPLEWVWRSLTYGRLAQLRRQPVVASGSTGHSSERQTRQTGQFRARS